LKDLRHRFLEFGGHDQAVGGTLASAGFAAFRAEARLLFGERVPRERFLRREPADVELALEEISDETLSHLDRFEPHGAGNPRPVFSCRAARAPERFRPIGESGLRGRIEGATADFDAICWSSAAPLAEQWEDGASFALHYRLSRSRWSGRPEIEIVQARAAQAEPFPSVPPSTTAELAAAP
jgi:single-stranded-DNA-specific exonuclease